MEAKEFVSYEIALALKELGFDEPCFASYVKESKEFTTRGFADFYKEQQIYAPLYQQAFRWFREKIIFRISEHKDKNGERFSVVTINDANFKQEYSTYEEAELECLKKLIEIVKK